jgi:hypothetical protein
MCTVAAAPAASPASPASPRLAAATALIRGGGAPRAAPLRCAQCRVRVAVCRLPTAPSAAAALQPAPRQPGPAPRQPGRRRGRSLRARRARAAPRSRAAAPAVLRAQRHRRAGARPAGRRARALRCRSRLRLTPPRVSLRKDLPQARVRAVMTCCSRCDPRRLVGSAQLEELVLDRDGNRQWRTVSSQALPRGRGQPAPRHRRNPGAGRRRRLGARGGPRKEQLARRLKIWSFIATTSALEARRWL